MSEKIEKMFSGISGKYDKMNNILSLGVHHRWRKKAARIANPAPGEKILDLAAGTGDLSIALSKAAGGKADIIAADFSREMLKIADIKFSEKNIPAVTRFADALELPFADNEFDISTIAFGIRNVDSVADGLKEMARVTKAGGRIVILEFGQPKGIFKKIYDIYSRKMMPSLGAKIADDEGAYDYLRKTSADFPCREDFLDIMRSTGKFSKLSYLQLTFGIAFIYLGVVK